jgi:hypothetical protein
MFSRRFGVGLIVISELLWSSALAQSPTAQASDTTHLLTILQNQLLDLEPNDARNNPEQSISQFEQNNALRIPDITWHYTVPSSPLRIGSGAMTLTINPSAHVISDSDNQQGFNIHTNRSDTNSSSTPWPTHTSNFTLSPLGQQPLLSILGTPATLSVSGSITVPHCIFSFATNPTCYPALIISNNSVTDANTPHIVFTISETNSAPRRLEAGASVTLDRSIGDITIALEAVETRVVPSITLSVTFNSGPVSPVGTDFSIADRVLTYDRLVELKQQLAQATSASADPLEAIRAKTLATAIHIISADTIVAKYPNIVRELLLTRAQDIATADQRTFDIRNLVLATSTMTPAQVDLLISRIDVLLADSSVQHQDALTLIRDQLVNARNSAQATSSAITVLRANFQTDLDRIVKEYQMYILEYAQYVTDEQLKALLNGAQRQAISTRLSPADVLISKDALSGRGQLLQTAFGLSKGLK